MNGGIASQRIDKWLWHARVVKTRSLAQKLVTDGKVRVDREKITNASHQVKASQVLTITLPREIKILKIEGFADKRGPYASACLLYDDLSPPKPERKSNSRNDTLPDGLQSIGRPTKHDRREAIRLKRNTS